MNRLTTLSLAVILFAAGCGSIDKMMSGIGDSTDAIGANTKAVNASHTITHIEAKWTEHCIEVDVGA